MIRDGNTEIHEGVERVYLQYIEMNIEGTNINNILEY